MLKTCRQFVRPLRAGWILAFLVFAAAPAHAASFVGTQTGPNEWTYALTYHPLDNYAVCPAPGNVATITLSGLRGVASATPPTSLSEELSPINLAWVPQVSGGGTVVTWTHQGAGTGNFGVATHVFGFKVITATPAVNGTVNATSDGFSIDVSVTGPCPVQPADDRDFIATMTNGPVAAAGDFDADGVLDAVDNCRVVYNPDQADRDSDGVGDACDNCAQLGNAAQTDSNHDGVGDACAAHYSEGLILEAGTKQPGANILVTATFLNSSGEDIVTIRPDCVNTIFTASIPGEEITVLLDPIIRERMYGIPNDLVTIPAGENFSVTCNVGEMYHPDILTSGPDGAAINYNVEAVYSNFVVDPDIDPLTGACKPATTCFPTWIGSVASDVGTIRIEGPALTNEPAPESATVQVDIKPGTSPNSINLGSNGVVPVAILSTPTFDARTVNPITVLLAGANVKVKGKGTPMASFQDVNGDGLVDLVVHVSTDAFELTGGDTKAFLQGKTFAGAQVIGSDSVRIVPAQ